MFIEQDKHESGVKRQYIKNMRNRRLSYQYAKRLRKRGATLKIGNRHLDRKVERCYPRGPAFLRIVALHSVAELRGT